MASAVSCCDGEPIASPPASSRSDANDWKDSSTTRMANGDTCCMPGSTDSFLYKADIKSRKLLFTVIERDISVFHVVASGAAKTARVEGMGKALMEWRTQVQVPESWAI
ncbi:hypothetical protein KCU90_g20, partial [Aureobasidium melanogenum]